MEKADFVKLIEENSEYKKDLFIRGFLITNSKPDNLNGFPFYGNWKCEEHSGFYFLTHLLTGICVIEKEERTYFLLGHAYNPFTMAYEEKAILENIAEVYGTEAYIERINDITGVFAYGCINNGKLEYLVDPSGM